jgi:hypothetical protein
LNKLNEDKVLSKKKKKKKKKKKNFEVTTRSCNLTLYNVDRIGGCGEDD